MEPDLVSSPPYLTLVGWSVILLAIHIALQSTLATRELGLDWNAGPRDEGLKPQGILAGRAARAFNNFRETYPAFLALAIRDNAPAWGIHGAWTWFVCRFAYIPLYLAGLPYVRSLVWLGSMVGLAVMFLALIQ